jgi:hypothetical protein
MTEVPTTGESPDRDRDRPLGAAERARRLLFGGKNLRELRRVVEANEVESRIGLPLSLDGTPAVRRAILPTVRLMQVKFVNGRDPEYPTTLSYTFTSAATVDENLDALKAFVSDGHSASRDRETG